LDRVTDFEIYRQILPLYFPRTSHEEAAAHSQLPPDTGYQNGETVVEERKIRISAFPGMYDGAVNVEEDYEEEEVEPQNGRVEESPAVLSMLHSDPDEEKRMKMSLKPAEVIEREHEEYIYARYLKNSRKEDLSDIAQLNILYQSGIDQLGRPIVVVVGHHIPAAKVDMERVLMYMIRTMDPVVDKNYVIVYLHSLMTSDHQPEFVWLRRVHAIFDRKYSKNLKAFYVVHPTIWLKLLFVVFSPFLSKTFSSDRLKYFDRLVDLQNVLDVTQLNLPSSIFKFDQSQNGSTWMIPTTSTTTQPSHEDL